MKVNWKMNETIIENVSELRDIVRVVRDAGLPAIVYITAADKSALAVGVGAPESVLHFVDVNGDTFHSLGDPRRQGRMQFSFQGQMQGFRCESAIPESDAIGAAEYFVEFGQQPPGVNWESD